MHKFFKFSILALAGFGTISLGACGIGDPLRNEIAMRVASPAWMIKRPVEAGPFVLTAFERMHEPREVASLYIEGNGEATAITGDGTFFDATPINPVGLHIAAMDKAENLAYVARPCQYSGLRNDYADACLQYWGDNQYSAETVKAYHDVLNGIKARYDVHSFNIIGYNGGATLAALMAGQRKDVLTLRTVAGRLDLDALGPSMNALARIPQHHYVAETDEVVPRSEIENYLNALGPTRCAEYTVVEDTTHEKGWANKWPELLKDGLPACYVPPEPAFVPIEKPEPIYVPRMLGDKK